MKEYKWGKKLCKPQDILLREGDLKKKNNQLFISQSNKQLQLDLCNQNIVNNTFTNSLILFKIPD